MRQERALRVVKREARERAAEGGSGVAPSAARAHGAEREMRAVVAGWVSEHRRVAEEVRRASAAVLLGARVGLESRA